MLPGFASGIRIGGVVVSLPPADLTVASTFISVSNEANPKTLSAQAIGEYASNRRTILSIQWRNSSTRTLDTVTVGGASAARLARASGASVNKNAEIWSLDTGVGTALEGLSTANIVLTASGANNAYTVTVYRALGVDQAGSGTATDATDPVSMSVTVPAGGAAVAVAANGSTSSASLDVVTEALNAVCSSATRGIHGYIVASGSLTTTLSGTVSAPLGCAVAFAPN